MLHPCFPAFMNVPADYPQRQKPDNIQESKSQDIPEWFTLPASFNNIMDLHGFDDEDVIVESDGDEPEPEWFTCQVSRYDVIELRGFDDDERVAKV